MQPMPWRPRMDAWRTPHPLALSPSGVCLSTPSVVTNQFPLAVVPVGAARLGSPSQVLPLSLAPSLDHHGDSVIGACGHHCASREMASEAPPRFPVKSPVATRLVFARHGETDWNAAGKLQGNVDTPLNGLGEAQAAAAGAWIAKHFSVDAVWSSHLRRAIDTATRVAVHHGKEVQRDDDLGETNLGVWQGLTWDEVHARYAPQVRAWRADPHCSAPGGESVVDRFHRMIRAVHRIALRHMGQTIVVVSHGGALEDVARMVLKVPFDKSSGLRKPNTCICVVDFWPGADAVAMAGKAVDEMAASVACAFPRDGLDPSTTSHALGRWELVEWGVTEHLALHHHATHGHGAASAASTPAGAVVNAVPSLLGGLLLSTTAGGGGVGGDGVPVAEGGLGPVATPTGDGLVDAADSDDETDLVSGGAAR